MFPLGESHKEVSGKLTDEVLQRFPNVWLTVGVLNVSVIFHGTTPPKEIAANSCYPVRSR